LQTTAKENLMTNLKKGAADKLQSELIAVADSTCEVNIRRNNSFGGDQWRVFAIKESGSIKVWLESKEYDTFKEAWDAARRAMIAHVKNDCDYSNITFADYTSGNYSTSSEVELAMAWKNKPK
jgi:hypothetical protein